MAKIFVNTLRILICAVVTIQLTGCGTLMYPERKGQKSGHIDGGVAILDGLGLLLFLIPGIIAFVVDFNNGTIYLPGTQKVSLNSTDIKQVKFDPKHSSLASIEKIIKEQTGQEIAFDQPGIKVTRLKSTDNVEAQLAKVLPDTHNDQIALLERQ
jgi:hypothetical protein